MKAFINDLTLQTNSRRSPRNFMTRWLIYPYYLINGSTCLIVCHYDRFIDPICIIDWSCMDPFTPLIDHISIPGTQPLTHLSHLLFHCHLSSFIDPLNHFHLFIDPLNSFIDPLCLWTHLNRFNELIYWSFSDSLDSIDRLLIHWIHWLIIYWFIEHRLFDSNHRFKLMKHWCWVCYIPDSVIQ